MVPAPSELGVVAVQVVIAAGEPWCAKRGDDRQLVGRAIATLQHLIAKELPGKNEH